VFAFRSLVNCVIWRGEQGETAMKIAAGFFAFGLAFGAPGFEAAQATNLVLNGGFELTTNGNGQVGYDTDVLDWALSAPPGYIFVFAPGTADTNGAPGYYSSAYGNVALWGPNNGSANGLPATSPAGGNFIAMDGDNPTGNSAIVQTIHGLTPGQSYSVKFDYAYSQQYQWYGPTRQNIEVCLGGTCATTPTLTNPSQGFTGWFTADYQFRATSASEVLSFLAWGNVPVPPMALLDGVSVDVPEPSTWVMILAGFAGLGFAGHRRARKRAAA
jgi:hypothetical protein